MFTECNCSMDRYLSCLLRLLPAMSVYLSLSASLSLFLTAAIVSAFKQRKYVNMPLKTQRSLQSSCGEIIIIIIEDTVSLESNMQQCNKSTHTLHTRIYMHIVYTHVQMYIFLELTFRAESLATESDSLFGRLCCHAGLHFALVSIRLSPRWRRWR